MIVARDGLMSRISMSRTNRRSGRGMGPARSRRQRDMISRAATRMLTAAVAAIALGAGSAFAQQPAEAQPTRAGILIEAQKAKDADLQPWEGDKAEQIFEKWEARLLGLGAWHPFFE